MDRNETIKTIKSSLKKRSGKTWSVTGGRGTAYGWIKIDAPPARQTAHWQLKPGMSDGPGNCDLVDTGIPGGYMTPAESEELSQLLGITQAHHQGISIPAGNDYYQEYLDRAAGRKPSRIGEPYWD